MLTRLTGLLLAAVVAATGLVATAGTASAHDGPMTKRFAREFAGPGARDSSVSNIDHVYELQWRLRREGQFRFRPNGRYGPATKAGVHRFQRQHGLRRTGNANQATWRALLRHSNHKLAKARNRCSGPGWHICYDRRHHQATLWRRGRLWNSWLVRGGSAGHKTRTGNYRVYWRDKDHVSSLYGSPMPHSQFFSGGQAFHGSTTMIDPYSGHSHGCVNMYKEDARQLWNITHHRKLRVHVYGRWS